MDTILITIIVLGSLGMLNTLYLSYCAYNKKPVRCIIFPPAWCQKVQQSKYSKMFGVVPNAYLGLLMYVGVVVCAALLMVGMLPFWPLATLIIFGALFSLYFTMVQAFILRAFCTWCVLSAIEFFVLTILIVLIWG